MNISESSMKNEGPGLEDLMCSVCLDILEEPVTFACTHSLCNSCWKSLKDTATESGVCCPECRQIISSPDSVNVNSGLWKLIQRRHSDELKNRRLSHLAEFKPISPKSPRNLLREMKEAKLSAEEKAIQTQLRRDEALARKLLLEEEEFEANEAQRILDQDAEFARQLESQFEREARAADEAEARRQLQLREDALLARRLYEEVNGVPIDDDNLEVGGNNEDANDQVGDNAAQINGDRINGIRHYRIEDTVDISSSESEDEEEERDVDGQDEEEDGEREATELEGDEENVDDDEGDWTYEGEQGDDEGVDSADESNRHLSGVVTEDEEGNEEEEGGGEEEDVVEADEQGSEGESEEEQGSKSEVEDDEQGDEDEEDYGDYGGYSDEDDDD